MSQPASSSSPPPPPPRVCGDYSELLKHLPPVDLAFAYGSGVFQQAGYEPASTTDFSRLPMLDVVFAVADPLAWHTENLRRNGHHYSSLKYLGPSTIARIQESFGAAIYYNTAVPTPGSFQPGRSMKYGVVSTAHLRQDLVEWTWLYVAGRMQKPVHIFKRHEALAYPMEANLFSAVTAALLLLPASFTDFDLYTKIAGLSYRGDFRMAFGENPKKVVNIVTTNIPHFHRLYNPILKRFPSVTATSNSFTTFQQDLSPPTRADLIRSLPLSLRSQLDIIRHPSSWDNVPAKESRKLVNRAIGRVVARSSFPQSVKGLFTAGVFTALGYILKKMRKAVPKQ